MLKFLLLGLLAQRPRHGYDLKAAFEHLLGGTWTLKISQIYAALASLERDGLVVWEPVQQELLPDRKVYSLTEAGEAELQAWASGPDDSPVRLRDAFFMKILVSTLLPEVDAAALVSAQRHTYLESLSRLVAMKDEPNLPEATALLLEGAVLRVQADLKWLELCETRMKEIRA